MLTQKQIHEGAVKAQTSDENVAREYCQHIVLSNLYTFPESAGLLFKGGTALRLVFNSPRYSEDLDFTGIDIDASGVETLLLKTLEAVHDTGIRAELEEAEPTTGGYISNLTCKWEGTTINLRIEISFREKEKKTGDIVVVNQGILPPYSMYILPEKQLVGEKIRAVLTRSKPRDFFDAYFLLRSHMVPPEEKSDLKNIKELLEKREIDFSRELKKFLPISMHALLKNFKESLLQEVRRAIG